jgi:hypothetical protein
MTPVEPHSPKSDAAAEAVSVRVHGGQVLLEGPGLVGLALAPDAAERTAERLLEAAAEARRTVAGGQSSGDRRKPPFPPSNLVSPHGAG